MYEKYCYRRYYRKAFQVCVSKFCLKLSVFYYPKPFSISNEALSPKISVSNIIRCVYFIRYHMSEANLIHQRFTSIVNESTPTDIFLQRINFIFLHYWIHSTWTHSKILSNKWRFRAWPSSLYRYNVKHQCQILQTRFKLILTTEMLRF